MANEDFQLYGTEAEKVAGAAATARAQQQVEDEEHDGRNDSIDSIAAAQLRAFVERIERMEEEKAAIAADIKEIYSEATGNGFDTKQLRNLVRLRKMDQAERLEGEAILELYLVALGMEAAG